MAVYDLNEKFTVNKLHINRALFSLICRLALFYLFMSNQKPKQSTVIMYVYFSFRSTYKLQKHLLFELIDHMGT